MKSKKKKHRNICLKCEKEFETYNKHQRLCNNCHKVNEAIEDYGRIV